LIKRKAAWVGGVTVSPRRTCGGKAELKRKDASKREREWDHSRGEKKDKTTTNRPPKRRSIRELRKGVVQIFPKEKKDADQSPRRGTARKRRGVCLQEEVFG